MRSGFVGVLSEEEPDFTLSVSSSLLLVLSRRMLEAALVKLLIPRTDFGTASERADETTVRFSEVTDHG